MKIIVLLVMLATACGSSPPSRSETDREPWVGPCREVVVQMGGWGYSKFFCPWPGQTMRTEVREGTKFAICSCATEPKP